MGICHSYAPDGRCISLLKVLLTNACNYDCLYCVNRASSNVPRARFTVDEVPLYARERAAIQPDLVVAMGATAAQCVFGKITPINKNRGRLIDLDDGTRVLVTVHRSYLLRLPDAEARALEYQRFIADLKFAAGLVRKSAPAA